MKRRLIAAVCLLALMVAWVPWSAVVAAAAQPLSLAQLQAKYPHGAYWNHSSGGNEDYTWTPCNHHTGNCTYNGSCGCNTYNNRAIQCMGFAYQLAALAYGDDPYTARTTDKNVSALDTLKPGDIVRYRWNGHSIFVTAVEGDTVTFADANWDNHCGIRWNATVSKETLRASFTHVKPAPYALAVEKEGALTVTASAQTVSVGQKVAVTLKYDGGGYAIGGVLGALTYDAKTFSYVSHSGAEGWDVNGDAGVLRYCYYAVDAKAPTSVALTLTFEATAAGNSDFAVVTEEFVEDESFESLGELTGRVAVAAVKPHVTLRYNAGGGAIANQIVAQVYRVNSDNGLNLRADAGTDKKKVTALPDKTEFTVAVGDTKTANGYTWGKTTYNGKTGWLVISDYVVKIADVWEGEWRVADGLVCLSDGTPLTHTAVCHEPVTTLADITTLELTKEGHRFGGWYTAADGKGDLWTVGGTPDSVYADGETVTLYARWIPILRGDVSGDGKVNNRDLGQLQQYLNDWDVSVSAESDMDGDGRINNRDLGLLQQLLNE